MDENFLKWGETAGTGYADPATWAVQLREEQYTQSLGKLFLGATGSSIGDTSAAVYGYATMLLATRGNAVFYMGDELADPTDFPEYHYKLGQPIGAQTVSANGVHQRRFSEGLVLVNPTLSRVTQSLGGTYSGSGLTRVTTVTMAPQTGLVLTRVTVAADRNRHSVHGVSARTHPRRRARGFDWTIAGPGLAIVR